MGNDFLSIDDGVHVTGNKAVREGLTPGGIRWAFTSLGYGASWYPLTWLSHMADVQLFGLHPAGHHAVNVLLHGLNTALVFWVLWRLTGGLWRAAAVAALFGVHPLRVESVAWVAERKDVLSALFWILALLAYLRWLERRSVGRGVALAALFALGLMSKPMVVTLPFVLLLLDFWPLGRLWLPRGARGTGTAGAQTAAPTRLLLEKAPLFALSAAASAMTVLAQRGTVGTLEQYPVAVRAGVAALGYASFLGKILWPRELMFSYPDPKLRFWNVLGASLLLAALTLAAARLVRRRPQALVGWLWFLGTLVPVVGFVVGKQQLLSDRYTYLPAVGALIAIVWLAADLQSSGARRGAALAALAAVTLLAAQSRLYLPAWRDDDALFRHLLSRPGADQQLLSNWGVVLLRKGRSAEASAILGGVNRPTPQEQVRVGLQRAAELHGRGRAAEAMAVYTQVLALDAGNRDAAAAVAALRASGVPEPPAGDPAALSRRLGDELEAERWLHQGDAIAAVGHFEIAIGLYQEAVRLNPDLAPAWNNLGSCYGRLGRHEEALAAFERAVAADPGHRGARENLGKARLRLGR